MKKPKISVIVPVYNVAPYISRALDCLLGQTIGTMQIICIDDGSTDGGSEILNAYALGDPRIMLIKFPENRGVSNARNAGLDAAQGDWIGFLDPDDWVDADFYAKLVAAAENAGADMALGNVEWRRGDESGTREDLLMRVDRNKHEFVYCWWAAIYGRRMIMDNEIRFPPGIICGQDFVFLNRAVLAANSVRTVYDTFYHYDMRENSSFSDALSPEKIDSQIAARRMALEHMNSQIIRAEDYIIIWNLLFRNFLSQLFERNSRADVRAKVANAAIDFYSNAKFKTLAVIEARKIGDVFYRLMESRDADGLVAFLAENEKKGIERARVQIKWFRLFCVIPFVRVRTQGDGTLVAHLFGFIPLFRMN
ncbi:MAG: glycosyltransferase [Rickettsiales bacterium]|jgi:glycosyltransferase involved in cell wall biosynthesis|nr:glycosyltransferase [Rickettsiales bacterium]